MTPHEFFLFILDQLHIKRIWNMKVKIFFEDASDSSWRTSSLSLIFSLAQLLAIILIAAHFLIASFQFFVLKFIHL